MSRKRIINKLKYFVRNFVRDKTIMRNQSTAENEQKYGLHLTLLSLLFCIANTSLERNEVYRMFTTTCKWTNSHETDKSKKQSPKKLKSFLGTNLDLKPFSHIFYAL